GDVEGSGTLRPRRPAGGGPGEDRAAGGVGESREGRVQPLGDVHSLPLSYRTIWLYNATAPGPRQDLFSRNASLLRLQRPDDRQEHEYDDRDDNGERKAQLPVVAEAVAARAHHEDVHR